MGTCWDCAEELGMGAAVKVTVVVATHNTANGVVKNVDSMLSQTMPKDEFEVFYVDDGSTDGTPDLIEAHVDGEPNFHVIRSTNSGWPGRPRNIGIDAANGEFIFFCDDDDWLEADGLANLYERATRDGADIVIGRTAGHNRNSHRDVTQVSLTNGDIRNPEHAQLLVAMTVHKLFRRSFLLDHKLRFHEGRVRLEDHLFMLPAFLRTQRVSIMHDRTVYHWVRDPQIGNVSYGRIEPYEYADSLAKIFAIIRDEIDDEETRRRFILTWYRRKVLRHFPQHHFLTGPDDYAEQIVDANRKLIDEWIPADYDTCLASALRARAALVRAGDTAMLRKWGQYERSASVRASVRSLSWDGDELVIRTRVEPVMTPPGGKPQPVLVEQVGDRVIRVLPKPFADLPALADIRDVTRHNDSAQCRLLVRRRESTGDVFQPSTSTRADRPVGDGRAGVAFAVETRINPLTADQGSPLSGTWDLFVSTAVFGVSADRRLGASDNPGVELPMRRFRSVRLVAQPILTSRNNLSLRLKSISAGAHRADGGDTGWLSQSRPVRMLRHASGRLRRLAAQAARKARSVVRRARATRLG
jgi:glycosyltransferase involved in cell wall biosynthesis